LLGLAFALGLGLQSIKPADAAIYTGAELFELPTATFPIYDPTVSGLSLIVRRQII